MSQNDLWLLPPIGKRAAEGVDASSFVGHVIIPFGIDREKFIRQCYSTSSVFIRGVDNQFENNVLVSKSLIHYLSFPADSKSIGSLVQVIVDPIYNTSKVVAIFNSQFEEQEIFEEGQWRVLKRGQSTLVDIDAKGKTGQLNITVDSGSSDKVESTFKFLNSSNKAVLNLMVQGNMNVEVDDTFKMSIQKELNFQIEDIDNNKGKITNIKYIAGEGFSYKDEFENEVSINEGEILLKNKNGEEFSFTKSGFALKNNSGNLKTIISDLIDSFEQAIILTPAGPGSLAPSTITKLEEIRTTLNLLFS